MSKLDRTQFRKRLEVLATRVRSRALSAEEDARMPMGQNSGDLSTVPMHMGDVSSQEFTQEIGAALLENEQYLLTEINAAFDRLDNGSYGKCENCGRAISRARLEAIPYTRFCIACAEKLHAGREVNLDEGRPAGWAAGIGLRAEGPPEGAPGGPEVEQTGGDRHAIGTPGGGSAIGGLAGTNIGDGEPEGPELEEAMASSTFDTEMDPEPPETVEEPGAYSGHSGGAVGGTPANKRASGGKL